MVLRPMNPSVWKSFFSLVIMNANAAMAASVTAAAVSLINVFFVTIYIIIYIFRFCHVELISKPAIIKQSRLTELPGDSLTQRCRSKHLHPSSPAAELHHKGIIRTHENLKIHPALF